MEPQERNDKLDNLNAEIYYLTLDLHNLTRELNKLGSLIDSGSITLDKEKESEIWDLTEEHIAISNDLIIKLNEYFKIEKELNIPISLSYRSLYRQLTA